MSFNRERSFSRKEKKRCVGNMGLQKEMKKKWVGGEGKETRMSFGFKQRRQMKNSLENIMATRSKKNNAWLSRKGSRNKKKTYSSRASLKSLCSFKDNESKDPDNIYKKFNDKRGFDQEDLLVSGFERQNSLKQNRMYHNRSQSSLEILQKICDLRVKSNSIKTNLNNEYFLLKKQMESEKKNVINTLNSIINSAMQIKHNFNTVFETEYKATNQFYRTQMKILSKNVTYLERKISNYEKKNSVGVDFGEMVDSLKLKNKFCRFPTVMTQLRENKLQEVYTLIQELAMPVPIKKTISSIDEYNEYLTALKDDLNRSQTSTLPKSSKKNSVHKNLAAFFTQNMFHEKRKSLNVSNRSRKEDREPRQEEPIELNLNGSLGEVHSEEIEEEDLEILKVTEESQDYCFLKCPEMLTGIKKN